MLRYLQETKRVLVPKGVARIQAYQGKEKFKLFNGMEGYYFDTKESFQRLVEEAGLKVVTVEYAEPGKPYIWITAQKD